LNEKKASFRSVAKLALGLCW